MLKFTNIFYGILYISFSLYMASTGSVKEFLEDPFLYFMCGVAITLGIGLFYFFSLLMCAVEDLLSAADEAIDESRELRGE